MKYAMTFLATLLSAGLMFSCVNSTKEEKSEDKGALEKISESVDAVKNLNKMTDYAQDMEARMEKLKGLSPVSNDVLKAVLPETLHGLKRTSLNVGDMSVLNMASAKGKYKNEDGTKSVDVDIMDGAGEGASGVVSLIFLGLHSDREEITEDGYEKTTEVEGHRAIVKEYTSGDTKDSEIQTVHAERFVISIKGNGYPLEELTAIFKSLDLSSLK